MHFKSCLLCGFVTFCVISAAPTTLLITLKDFTREKCPSYESLASKSLFLDRCIDSRPFDVEDWANNAKIMLCSLYYNVFQHFCTSTNSSFYNTSSLTKEFEQIPEEFSNKPTEVCNTLKLINSTILKPDLVKVFNKSSRCVHLCTDIEDKVIDICSLTTFIWNLTVHYRTKDRSMDTKGDMVTISSGIKHTILPMVSNGVAKSKINMSNGNDNDANKSQNNDKGNQVKYTAGKQQSLSSESKVTQEGPYVDVQVPVSKITIVEDITTQNDKDLSKPNNDKSAAQQSDQHQGAEFNSAPDGKQSFIKANSNSDVVGNKLEVTDEAESDGKKIKTNNINANHDEVNSNDADLESNPTRNVQVKGNPKTESIPIVSQPSVQKEAKKQDDIPEDTKSDDLNVYMDKEDDDDNENDPTPSKKVTKVNEGKPEGNENELSLPKSSEVKSKVEVAKPKEIDEDIAANYKNQNIDDSDSYFFSYFMMVCVVFICGYVAYHNKQKILALVLEGRKGRRPSRTRRPNSSNYRKLDSTLEEAVTSSCNKNSPQVIY